MHNGQTEKVITILTLYINPLLRLHVQLFTYYLIIAMDVYANAQAKLPSVLLPHIKRT